MARQSRGRRAPPRDPCASPRQAYSSSHPIPASPALLAPPHGSSRAAWESHLRRSRRGSRLVGVLRLLRAPHRATTILRRPHATASIVCALSVLRVGRVGALLRSSALRVALPALSAASPAEPRAHARVSGARQPHAALPHCTHSTRIPSSPPHHQRPLPTRRTRPSRARAALLSSRRRAAAQHVLAASRREPAPQRPAEH